MPRPQPPRRWLVHHWIALGSQFLPFADAADEHISLGRLLRLSLFQVSVGMALVLLVGTLNRVMIVELGVPASLVAAMLALPVLYAPLRAWIGFRSDTHRSALGWRRVPFIWKGALLQFGGLAVMPFALLVLAGSGDARQWPLWMGYLGAASAFLLVGAGLHTAQTAGLSLATDLVPAARHPSVVGLMFCALLAGSVVGGVVFSHALQAFSPGRLVQVIQAAAVATLVLNAVALWKQEARQRGRHLEPRPAREADFRLAWQAYIAQPGVPIQLAVVALGSLAFGMQDVLLEPFGGEVLRLSVSGTTGLSALLALGTLVGFVWASWRIGRGLHAQKAMVQALAAALPAFALLILTGWLAAKAPGTAPIEAVLPMSQALVAMYAAGALGVGLTAGVFSHGSLTDAMSRAPAAHRGLALGAWGAAQATAAGVGVTLGAVVRDLWQGWRPEASGSAAGGYLLVYSFEMVLLAITGIVLLRLRQHARTFERRSS